MKSILMKFISGTTVLASMPQFEPPGTPRMLFILDNFKVAIFKI